MFLQVAAIYSGLNFQSISGNVELIQILNRLGHGISYSQLEEVDTALCLQKLAMTPEDGVPLPSNIYPGTNQAHSSMSWNFSYPWYIDLYHR